MGVAAYFLSLWCLLHSLQEEKSEKFVPFDVEECCRLERCVCYHQDDLLKSTFRFCQSFCFQATQ